MPFPEKSAGSTMEKTSMITDSDDLYYQI